MCCNQAAGLGTFFLVLVLVFGLVFFFSFIFTLELIDVGSSPHMFKGFDCRCHKGAVINIHAEAPKGRNANAGRR